MGWEPPRSCQRPNPSTAAAEPSGALVLPPAPACGESARFAPGVTANQGSALGELRPGLWPRLGHQHVPGSEVLLCPSLGQPLQAGQEARGSRGPVSSSQHWLWLQGAGGGRSFGTHFSTSTPKAMGCCPRHHADHAPAAALSSSGWPVVGWVSPGSLCWIWDTFVQSQAGRAVVAGWHQGL